MTNDSPTAPKRGRTPLPPEKRVLNLGICGTTTDLEYLLTWNEGNSTLAFGELIAELRRVRPAGRHSGPVAPPGCKDKPGTRTSLKRRIRELETRTHQLENQLRAAGLTPLQIE